MKIWYRVLGASEVRRTMSKKKAGGKASQHVSPSGKRLGVKVTHGDAVAPGMILVRQRGIKVSPGRGVKVGRDHTLYAISEGVVNYGQKFGKKIVSIVN